MKNLILLLIALLLLSSCSKKTFRTEPYKPSMNPAKAYQKAYKPNYIDFRKLDRFKKD